MATRTTEAFRETAETRVMAQLQARREAGLHDTIVAVIEGPEGTLYEGSTFLSSQPQFGFCAERHALHDLEHDRPGVDSFERLFVAGAVPEADHGVVTPCGACRHALYEVAPEATVICSCVVREETGWQAFPTHERFTVAELYPEHVPLPTWD